MTTASADRESCSAAAQQFGDFIHGLSQRQTVLDGLLRPLKAALLDIIAASLSGARQPVVETALSLVVDRLPGEATIIGSSGRKLPVDAAALVNGAMGHATDYDDVSTTMWGHATAPVFPVVLALAERQNLTGARFLNAFLAGRGRDEARRLRRTATLRCGLALMNRSAALGPP